IELHSIPASHGRIAGYRIGENQSGDNGTILQPVGRWRGRPLSKTAIRFACGTTLLSNSTCLPAMSGCCIESPVTLPPGRLRHALHRNDGFQRCRQIPRLCVSFACHPAGLRLPRARFCAAQPSPPFFFVFRVSDLPETSENEVICSAHLRC